MAGISSKAAGGLENKKKYQQYELNTDFDLDIYESFYRTYDPQIGRFLQIDPEPNFSESPYVSMGNNPISNVDPLGNSWWDIVIATILSVVDNTVPGSNMRALYQPQDPDDYNNALRSSDAAMLAVGAAMMVDGTKNIGGGVVLLAAGGTGAPVIVAGVVELALGADISLNASINIAKGYNYGKESNPIVIADKDKVPRGELNPPNKPGNSPTFKEDGKPVELHHEAQNPNGPYREMHPDAHRGKGNDKVNHPNKDKPTKVDRKDFNKKRKEYWKKEYPKLPKPTFKPKPKG